MRRPLELYPEDGELHRQEARARRRTNNRARAAAAPIEDTPDGTTAREFNLFRESRENSLAEFRESTANLDPLVSPDTAIPSSSTQAVATAGDTSGTSSGETSLRAPGSWSRTRDRPEVAAQRAIEAPHQSANDRGPIIHPLTVLAVPRPNRDSQEEFPSLRMADSPTAISIDNEELSPLRPLLGATPLSRGNQISLTSALAADAPSPPLAPASPTESSTSSVEDALRTIYPTAMAFSQADFDSWYNYQNEATRALVSYADYQHYALHGSGPPYGAFLARSVDHIRQNSILRVRLLTPPVIDIRTFDLDPLQCPTMQGFVRTLETAARDRGLSRHPDTGREEEVPVFQSGVIHLDHHAVGGSRRFHEASQLLVEIEDPDNILYDFWWKSNFEYGRRDVLLGTIDVERWGIQ